MADQVQFLGLSGGYEDPHHLIIHWATHLFCVLLCIYFLFFKGGASIYFSEVSLGTVSGQVTVSPLALIKSDAGGGAPGCQLLKIPQGILTHSQCWAVPGIPWFSKYWTSSFRITWEDCKKYIVLTWELTRTANAQALLYPQNQKPWWWSQQCCFNKSSVILRWALAWKPLGCSNQSFLRHVKKTHTYAGMKRPKALANAWSGHDRANSSVERHAGLPSQDNKY